MKAGGGGRHTLLLSHHEHSRGPGGSPTPSGCLAEWITVIAEQEPFLHLMDYEAILALDPSPLFSWR